MFYCDVSLPGCIKKKTVKKKTPKTQDSHSDGADFFWCQVRSQRFGPESFWATTAHGSHEILVKILKNPLFHGLLQTNTPVKIFT